MDLVLDNPPAVPDPLVPDLDTAEVRRRMERLAAAMVRMASPAQRAPGLSSGVFRQGPDNGAPGWRRYFDVSTLQTPPALRVCPGCDDETVGLLCGACDRALRAWGASQARVRAPVEESQPDERPLPDVAGDELAMERARRPRGPRAGPETAALREQLLAVIASRGPTDTRHLSLCVRNPTRTPTAVHLGRMVELGLLRRVEFGVYALPEDAAEPTTAAG